MSTFSTIYSLFVSVLILAILVIESVLNCYMDPMSGASGANIGNIGIELFWVSPPTDLVL